MIVIKRDGIKKEEFKKTKIEDAICNAIHFGSGEIDMESATKISKKISNNIEKTLKAEKHGSPTVRHIEREVYRELIKHGLIETARCYEGYRAIADFKRNINTSDENILGLIHGTNHKTMDENSNKNPRLAPTQRDLIAGEISKDIARRKLLPTRIIQAHDNGILHYHDMDYAMQPIFNCCLINIKDMLDNGTVINGSQIETPKSFGKACNIMTQIIAQVASAQYGGQSINIKHLGKYLRKTYQKEFKNAFKRNYKRTGNVQTAIEWSVQEAKEKRAEELKNGVQTIQYQINTLQTSNGR